MEKLKKQSTEVRLSVLEHTVVGQNASVNEKLGSMDSVLREIHNKLDQTILSNAVEMEKMKGQIALNVVATAAVNSKVNKFFGGLLTIFAAMIGGIFSMPELFLPKK